MIRKWTIPIFLASSLLSQPSDFTLCMDLQKMHVYCIEICKQTGGQWTGNVQINMVENEIHCVCKKEKGNGQKH